MDVEEESSDPKDEHLALGDFKLRPLQEYEEWLTITGAFEGQWWQHLRRAWRKDRDLSSLLLKEFIFAYAHKSNIIIVIKGIMGGGKSILALSIAKHLFNVIREILDLEVQIYITFSEDETFKQVAHINRGDIIIQDESQRQSGEGSMTVKHAIFNVQENVRANQNCFIFCSPTMKGFQNACHLLLEPFGIDYEHKVTRVKVYSASSERPLGWATIPKFEDPELDAYYEERKVEHVQRVLKNQGLSSVVYDLQRLKEEAKYLLEKARKEFGNVDLQKKHLKLIVPFANIPGATAYREKVVDYAQVLLEKAKAPNYDRLPAEAPKFDLSTIEFERGLALAFIQAIQLFIKEFMPHLLGTQESIAEECALIYEYYLEGLRPRRILKATGLPLSDRTMGRRLVTLDEFLTNPRTSEKIGKLYEDVFCAFYRQQGHEVAQGGGSVPGGVDAVVDGQVWSLKCYHDDKNPTIKIPFSEISQDEKTLAVQTTKKLGVSFLNPFWFVESRIEIDLENFERTGFVRFRKPSAAEVSE